MLTGKELRTARENKKMSLHHAAAAAHVTAETLRNWEASDIVRTRSKGALSKLLNVLGFSTEAKLRASIPVLKKIRSNRAATKAATNALHEINESYGAFPGNFAAAAQTTKAAVLSVKELEKELKATFGERVCTSSHVAEYTNMLGFYMGDQARRSALAKLLKAAIRCGITIHGLERAIDGNG